MLSLGGITIQVTTFSPLFRHSIGFDRFSDLFESALQNTKTGDAYPPYNIEKHGENDYRITMAVAGFKPEEIKIVAHDDELMITATTSEQANGVEYLYKGIATRNFQRKFNLSDYIKVAGARIADGLLTVDLVREVPEERKPRTIEIMRNEDLSKVTAKTTQSQAIENKVQTVA